MLINIGNHEYTEVWEEYADGCYLYIPRKIHKAIQWGEVCGSRGKVSLRNEQIYSQFSNGIKVSKLAKQYFLSERTIQNYQV